MRLWLIRHGETQANIDGLYSGHAPTPLTARGIEQAQNLHTLLHGVSFDLVLCSELERAQHTARRVLSDRQLPVQIIPERNVFWRLGDATSSRPHARRCRKL